MRDRMRILELLGDSTGDHTLPQAFYSDPDVYEFDLSAVFTRTWLMVGFEAELPDAGSHMALSVGRNPILLVRGRDGLIRGFHNTCRHRGAQICPEGHGRSRKLVCPYHKWTYELDGRLIGATRMPPDFALPANGLRSVPVQLLAGCIYVALTEEAPDFGPFRAAVEPLLAPYQLANAKVAFESTLIEQANWKLVMENARECYHCAASHPELRRSYPVMVGRDFGDTEHHRQFAARMQSLGLATTPREGAWWYAERYPLNAGMESLSADGKAVVARRLVRIEEREIGALWWAIEPNNFCHAFSDYAFMFCAIPLGPEQTRVVCKWLVHKEAIEGVDYSLESLVETWTKTNLQDRDLAENNQRGVNGLGYVPGRYSQEAEDFVIRFGTWYRAAVRSAAQGI